MVGKGVRVGAGVKVEVGVAITVATAVTVGEGDGVIVGGDAVGWGSEEMRVATAVGVLGTTVATDSSGPGDTRAASTVPSGKVVVGVQPIKIPARQYKPNETLMNRLTIFCLVMLPEIS
jgi:hypothetical protein